MEFNTFSELQKYSDAFKTFKPKEKVFIKEEETFYELDDNNVWQPLVTPVVETGQTIAEVKTASFTELGPLTEGQLKLIPEIIATFEKLIDQKHYMLMCKDISYFTMFKGQKYFSSDKIFDFSQTVLEVCYDLGEIYEVCRTADEQALEIWIKPKDDTLRCFLLFGYDAGVITYGKG